MQINTQLTRLEMPIRRYFIDLNKMPCKCLLHRGISSYAHNLQLYTLILGVIINKPIAMDNKNDPTLSWWMNSEELCPYLLQYSSRDFLTAFQSFFKHRVNVISLWRIFSFR